MTYEEMKTQFNSEKPKRVFRDEEHKLQKFCVRWFRMQYPELKNLLFAVPNGGRRDELTGAKLKEEGATPGVSDLILLKSNKKYSTLCIEMKTKVGRQSESQKKWQKEVESVGNKYVVCRSIEEFMNEVNNYLS
jgi:hypothetical protein